MIPQERLVLIRPYEGASSSSTYGTIQNYGGYSTYSGTTTYTPTYGVVGTGVTSQTRYTRVFRLDMLDKPSRPGLLRNAMREKL